MKFCEFSPEMFQEITNAFQSSFSMPDSILTEPYSFFKAWSEGLNDGLDYITPFFKRELIQPKTVDTVFLNKYNDQEYYLGIDLPIFISQDSNTKNVLIVAEDPLRDPTDKLIEVSKEHALLSTPFATHLDSCRKRLKEYWNFHESLLNNGFNIYITDINKLWLKKSVGVKATLPNDLMEHFKKTLQAEIKLVNPKMIIVYGKKAAFALHNMNINFKERIVAFPHPSKSANGTWKKLFDQYYPGDNKSCSAENKVQHMTSQIMVNAI